MPEQSTPRSSAAALAQAPTSEMCEFAEWSTQSLGKPIVRLFRYYSAYMDQMLAPYGISAAHVPLLGYLWEGGGGDTQNEIAKTLGVDKATVSRTVAYLVRAGLVIQSVSPRDSRAFTVELTEAGELLCGPVGAVLRGWTSEMTEGLRPEQLEILQERLQFMVEKGADLVTEATAGDDTL